MTRLYLDVHVPGAIALGLRRRAVDVLTAQEDETTELADADLLRRAGGLGRLLFTQDIRFKAMAEEWQRTGRSFAGRVFGRQLRGSVGAYVRDLELIAKASTPEEWRGRVEELPLR